MARVLIVHKGEKRTAEQSHRRGLLACGVSLFTFDPVTLTLEPRCDLGKIYGAEACVIGLRSDIVKHLVETYQVQCDPQDVLSGSVAKNTHAIQHWIRRNAPVPPVPTFAEIAEEARGQCDRLIYAKGALDHANKVSSSARDGAETFPDFLRESIAALVKLVEMDNLTGGDLSNYFSREAPLATYASVGKEFVKYEDPFHPGKICTSLLHLKPAKERRGYHDPSIKPRLHFDIVTAKPFGDTENGQSLKYAVVLYFGPHLPPGATAVITVTIQSMAQGR